MKRVALVTLCYTLAVVLIFSSAKWYTDAPIKSIHFALGLSGMVLGIVAIFILGSASGGSFFRRQK